MYRQAGSADTWVCDGRFFGHSVGVPARTTSQETTPTPDSGESMSSPDALIAAHTREYLYRTPELATKIRDASRPPSVPY